MIGVLIMRDALMISLIRGTPRVICALLGQGSPQSTCIHKHTHTVHYCRMTGIAMGLVLGLRTMSLHGLRQEVKYVK